MIAALRSSPAIVGGLWAVWSIAFIAIKLGLSAASPEVFALLRVGAAVVALAAVVAVRRLATGAPMPAPRVHRFCLGLGMLNVAGFLTFQNLGMADAPVGLSSVLIYTQPLLVALGARFLLRERLSPRRLTGLLLGWAGVVLVVGAELDAGGAPGSSVVLLLLSASCWAAGTILFKWAAAEGDLWQVLLWQNVYGLVPIGLVVAVRPGEMVWGAPLAFGVLWAGVAASVAGFGLQFVLLRRGEASVVSSWIFAVPILAAALGVVVLAEPLHVGLVVGGAAVAAGIYLVNSSSRRSATAEAVGGP